MAEPPTNAVRLDPAVDAAKRIIVALQGEIADVPEDYNMNDDVITVCVVVLRLAGYQITDMTGEDHPNTTPPGEKTNG